MSGNFQVRFANQFKSYWGGPFKIWADQAHSLSNETGLMESSLASLWTHPLQTRLCVHSQIYAQLGRGLRFDVGK